MTATQYTQIKEQLDAIEKKVDAQLAGQSDLRKRIKRLEGEDVR
jgi:tetrahydromethanopterin S-methyltransferase subunit G